MRNVHTAVIALTLATFGVLSPVATAQPVTGAIPQAEAAAPPRRPDVIYVPTPEDVVAAMLDVTKVTADDIVYDLGCGDGRIVITAAKARGARGVGIDIDPQRIAEATENARQAGVTNRVTLLEADLFTADISEATVVTLYLLPSLNLKLMPKLLAELEPGTRIASHAFNMGDEWPPEQTLTVNGRNVYYWTVPAR